MSATRSRKEELTYKRHLNNQASDECQFCAIKKGDKQFISATKYFKVIRNIFAYSIWDGQTVTDHLMVLPKRHIDNIASFSAAEGTEFLKLISRYEKQGYNIYARAPASVIKSVAHQHTHLIKTKGAAKKLIFLIRLPVYFRFVK